jgi:nucleoid-associated protein YgaU
VTRSSSRIFLWGGIAVVAIAAVVAIVVTWQSASTPTQAPAVAQKIEVPAPAPPTAAPPKPVAASPQPAPTAPPTPAPAAPAKTVAAPAPQAEAPRFDIVRVDPSGHAVLAGRAAPDSEVTVYDGGRAVGRVTADKDGNWVLVPDQPLPSGQSQLTLSAKAKDGTETRADGVVAMLVPERVPTPAPTPAVKPAPESAAPVAPVATVAPAPVTPTVTAKTEAPIAVLIPKEGPATALQLPALKGNGEDRLSMDIIEYGTNGDVILEGRSAPGAQISAYLDNKKIGNTTADQDGKWRIVTTENVPAGRYKLKLESQNAAGKQVAELTMPFERASLPEQIPSDLVIVQPGNSLWRIARRSYGHGRRYVEIYHANRKQISNPQLIFPGQLLQVPGKS